jgi:hypothetical protein
MQDTKGKNILEIEKMVTPNQTFRLPQEFVEVLEILGNGDKTAALLNLVSKPLLAEMTTPSLAEKSVDPVFLRDVNTPRAIVIYYRQYIEACFNERGEKMPDGSEPNYYFAEPPRGGYWEKIGATGYGVLAKNQRFYIDGIQTDVKLTM